MIFQEILHQESKTNYTFDFIQEIGSLPCLSIVNRSDDLDALQNPQLKEWMTFDNFIIFGTGGSCLGAKCIYSIAESLGHCGKKVKFCDNLDSDSLHKIFTAIDIRKTGFLCISKSGETLETVTQLILAINYVSSFIKSESTIETKINDFIRKKFVIITEDKPSSIKVIAENYRFLCFDHPEAIGGRFAVFSIVGALPALLCGIDPSLIRKGGKLVLDGIMDNVINGASFVMQNIQQNISQHVSFIYSDKLIPFGEWLAQLYAESSGKMNRGVTPITARGSVDQHSQLQLYMDGHNDKCFSFFYENYDCDMSIDASCMPEKLQFLANKKVSDVFKAQCNATILALIEKKRNIRKITVPKITPEILGALFMHFMLEVVCVCKALEINPFDQPGVELGKKITKKLLAQ